MVVWPQAKSRNRLQKRRATCCAIRTKSLQASAHVHASRSDNRQGNGNIFDKSRLVSCYDSRNTRPRQPDSSNGIKQSCQWQNGSRPLAAPTGASGVCGGGGHAGAHSITSWRGVGSRAHMDKFADLGNVFFSLCLLSSRMAPPLRFRTCRQSEVKACSTSQIHCYFGKLPSPLSCTASPVNQ